MITINGIKFTSNPCICGVCPALHIGKNDSKGWCTLWELHKCRYNSVPRRCVDIFDKAFKYPDGKNLVIVLKD